MILSAIIHAVAFACLTIGLGHAIRTGERLIGTPEHAREARLMCLYAIAAFGLQVIA